MTYLLLHLALVQIFILGMRYVQLSRWQTLTVVASNYVVGALVMAVIHALRTDGHVSVDVRVAALGAVIGVNYFAHLLVVLACYRLVGTGIAIAVIQSAVIAPVILSHVIWPQEETMSVWRWCAVVLLPVAMLLMRPNHGTVTLPSIKADLFLVLSFVLGAANLIGHKLATKLGPDEVYSAYVLWIFLAAAGSSTAYLLFSRINPKGPECLIGSLLGIANCLATLMIVLGVAALTAVVFYTIASPLTIVLSLLGSLLLWHEKITRRQSVGIAAAIAIVVMAQF